VNDRLGFPCGPGDVIVYGSDRGNISFGVIAEVKNKVADNYDWRTKVSTPGWKTTLKVRVQAGSWKGSREHVTLQELRNFVRLEGEAATKTRNLIDESWVDNEA
jgi:hypothetical protein